MKRTEHEQAGEGQRLNETVELLLGTLQKYHPAHTDLRVQAIRSIDQVFLDSLVDSNRERAAIVSLLGLILNKEAREDDSSIAVRSLRIASPIAMAIGVLATLRLNQLTRSSDAGWSYYLGLCLVWVMSSGLLVALLTPPFAAVATAYSRRLDGRVRAAAAGSLGLLQSRSALAALANACRDRSRRVRESAASAVAELLPELLREGMAPLTGEESVALARALPRFGIGLMATVLDALEGHGSPAALQHLILLEYEWTYSRKMEGTDLQGRIRRTISRLSERRQEERRRDTLLRPSEPDQVSLLLRPAWSAASVDPDILLRSEHAGD